MEGGRGGTHERKYGIWATPYVLNDMESKFIFAFISAFDVFATCRHHSCSLLNKVYNLFLYSVICILGLGTLALNSDHSITQTIEYCKHVCLYYICVRIREDKEGRLIKDNTSHFRPLKGEKRILDRSKRLS